MNCLRAEFADQLREVWKEAGADDGQLTPEVPRSRLPQVAAVVARLAPFMRAWHLDWSDC